MYAETDFKLALNPRQVTRSRLKERQIDYIPKTLEIEVSIM
jgi:hypothetical protein